MSSRMSAKQKRMLERLETVMVCGFGKVEM